MDKPGSTTENGNTRIPVANGDVSVFVVVYCRTVCVGLPGGQSGSMLCEFQQGVFDSLSAAQTFCRSIGASAHCEAQELQVHEWRLNDPATTTVDGKPNGRLCWRRVYRKFSRVWEEIVY